MIISNINSLNSEKPIKGILKLYIDATKASSTPPVGPVISQAGLNIADFCKNFNSISDQLLPISLPTIVFIYLDNSYDFIIKLPTTTSLIKNLIFNGAIDNNKLKIIQFKRKIRRQFSNNFNKRNFFIYILSPQILFELAFLKSLQLIHIRNIQNISNMILGSAYSMGVTFRYLIN